MGRQCADDSRGHRERGEKKDVRFRARERPLKRASRIRALKGRPRGGEGKKRDTNGKRWRVYYARVEQRNESLVANSAVCTQVIYILSTLYTKLL